MITSKNLVHHEFIGLNVEITNAKDKSLKLLGTVIDETKNMISIIKTQESKISDLTDELNKCKNDTIK